jgi:hypothetical protein
MQVVGYTNAGQPDKAIAEIDKLEKSFDSASCKAVPGGIFRRLRAIRTLRDAAALRLLK